MTRSELARLFRRERARFASRYPRLAAASLAIETTRHHMRGAPGRVRDLAWAETDTLTVVLVARALRRPRAEIVGILRHELGHLADRRVGRPGAERRADRIAERVGGQRISYSEPHHIQTVGRGVWPRPSYLHQ